LATEKSNCTIVSQNKSTKKRNEDFILKTQIKTNIFETSNQKNSNIKRNTSDINCIDNSCNIANTTDTDASINNNNNNSKQFCVDKIQYINTIGDYNDVSNNGDGKNVYGDHWDKDANIFTDYYSKKLEKYLKKIYSKIGKEVIYLYRY
jgi:hypothetical protein